MSSRRQGRPHRPMPVPTPASASVPPAMVHHLAVTHSTHPRLPLRNPWVAEESDHTTSSSENVPPPRAARTDQHSHHRSRSNSLASSSRAPSRIAGFPAPGCCSPGGQLLCYYCLRAALLTTLFGGAALAVAGVVLRVHGRLDLGVLLYIGALAALVSALLLVVQQRARRHALRRHLNRTGRPVTGTSHQAHEEGIPLQNLPSASGVYVVAPPALQSNAPQIRPHSHAFIRLDDISDYTGGAIPSVSSPRSSVHIMPAEPSPEEQVHNLSVSGVPWWRFTRGHKHGRQTTNS